MKRVGKENSFTVKIPERHDLSQVIKANVSCDAMSIVCTLDMLWWEQHFTSVVFLPNTHSLHLTWEKHQTIPTCGAFYETAVQYSSKWSKKGNCYQKRAMRCCRNQQEPKETWRLNVTWYSGSGPGREGHEVKTKESEKVSNLFKFIALWKRLS